MPSNSYKESAVNEIEKFIAEVHKAQGTSDAKRRALNAAAHNQTFLLGKKEIDSNTYIAILMDLSAHMSFIKLDTAEALAQNGLKFSPPKNQQFIPTYNDSQRVSSSSSYRFHNNENPSSTSYKDSHNNIHAIWKL